jgi:hypothetical protein
MKFIDNMLEVLRNNANLVSYLSLLISAITYLLTRHTNRRFARNEFVKKQIQEVIELTSYLNGELFEVRFTSFSDNGSSSNTYTTNIFEIKNLEAIDLLHHFIDRPIAFSRTSNQILDIKKYITNPFIPSSIADELSKFYSFNNGDITADQVEGELVIVINSKIFEETDFQKLANGQARLRDPSAFAFESFDNLIECSRLLEKAIVSWLQKYKVDEINIRSYSWHE